MPVHVAILHRQYLQLILSGRKVIESRLTVRPIVPYRAIAPGDCVYFKASSGPYMAKAKVERVLFFDNLNPQKIAQLQKQYNAHIGGDDAYWHYKRFSRYASLIWLTEVTATNTGPNLPPSTGPAWFVLPDVVISDNNQPATNAQAPMRESRKQPVADVPSMKLTAGALRNRYLRAPYSITGQVRLIMPDGRTVETHVTPKGIFRHRHWQPYFTPYELQAGDVVIFEPVISGDKSNTHDAKATGEVKVYRVTVQGVQASVHASPLSHRVRVNEVAEATEAGEGALPQHHQPFDSTRLRNFITPAKLRVLLNLAQREDLGAKHDDVTSRLLIPEKRSTTAVMRSRVAGCLAGAALLPAIARLYDRTIRLELHKHDGDLLQSGDTIARFQGPLRSILAVERIALNFCTHLSGIATLTHEYVQQVVGTKAVICDTRKTIPTLRELAKYAVVCGGGQSHRMGLYDAVLVKDNHLAHLSPDEYPVALSTMIAQARRIKPTLQFIEIEVDRLEQLERVLPCQPDIVLLDNMPPKVLQQAVNLRNRLAPNVLLEASGGVNLRTVKSIARTGVERISVGAITHSAPALDLGLDIP